MIKHRDIHKFLRGCLDNGGGDQKPRKRGKICHRPEKELFVRRRQCAHLCLFALHRFLHCKNHKRRKQRNAEQRKHHQSAPGGIRVKAKTVDKAADACQGAENTHRDIGIFQLINRRFRQGEHIVQRPVKHKARRRGIKKEQEEDRHAVQLNLRFGKASLGENHAGNQIDNGHDNGQKIDRQPRNMQKPVRLSEIRNRPERNALQNGKPRQKPICRDEKRNFKKERRCSAQNIGRLIIVLPVICLQHEHALITLERLFDMGHAAVQRKLRLLLLRLHGVRPLIQRQHQNVHTSRLCRAESAP